LPQLLTQKRFASLIYYRIFAPFRANGHMLMFSAFSKIHKKKFDNLIYFSNIHDV
jgi:hypothetical protein